MIPANPQVSFIVVNLNGAAYLPRCLEAIAAQTVQDFEILLVDNGSTDGSPEAAAARWPGLRIVRLGRNAGFAAANNLGAQQARGEWLALVNNDAFLHSDWLERMLSAAGAHPQFGSFAARLVVASDPTRMDGSGDVYHISGNAWRRDHHQPVSAACQEFGEVFSPCAAAALYRRDLFLQAGGFDARYGSYHEDVDLGFRLRLMGFPCAYVPEAAAEHVGSATFGEEGDYTIYHVHRNLVWAYLSDMPGWTVWACLPHLWLGIGIFLAYYTRRGHGKAIWKANLDALRGLPEALRKRRQVQAARRAPVARVLAGMDRSLLGPYTLGRNAARLRRLGRALGGERSACPDDRAGDKSARRGGPAQ